LRVACNGGWPGARSLAARSLAGNGPGHPQEVALVSQEEQHVEVYRRSTGWQQERFSADQVIKLDQLDLELPLDLIYEGFF